jgi:lysozyme family protein
MPLGDAQIINDLIEREGGYVDNPADGGGPTKYGITLKTLADWRRPNLVTSSEVEALTIEEARAIYAQRYLIGPGISKIQDFALRALTLDAAVNHGPVPAIQLLQRAVGVKDDGVLGPVTLAAIPRTGDSRILCVHALAERLRLYGRIITKNLTDRDKDGIPDSTEMAEGWLDRTATLLESV